MSCLRSLEQRVTSFARSIHRASFVFPIRSSRSRASRQRLCGPRLAAVQIDDRVIHRRRLLRIRLPTSRRAASSRSCRSRPAARLAAWQYLLATSPAAAWPIARLPCVLVASRDRRHLQPRCSRRFGSMLGRTRSMSDWSIADRRLRRELPPCSTACRYSCSTGSSDRIGRSAAACLPLQLALQLVELDLAR